MKPSRSDLPWLCLPQDLGFSSAAPPWSPLLKFVPAFSFILAHRMATVLVFFIVSYLYSHVQRLWKVPRLGTSLHHNQNVAYSHWGKKQVPAAGTGMTSILVEWAWPHLCILPVQDQVFCVQVAFIYYFILFYFYFTKLDADFSVF